MSNMLSRIIAVSAGAGLALAAPAIADPAVWTLSDEDTTISIVGTVHYLPEGVDWRTGRIGEAFDAAHTVCFELDAEGRALETFAMMMSDRGVFSGDARLTDHLTKEQTAELKEIAAFYDIPFSSLNIMKPWFASLTIDEYAVGELGYGDGVEFTLYPEVAATGKELCELETPEEQLGQWVDMAIEDQINTLFADVPGTENMSIEEQIEFGKDQLNELVDNWSNGNVDALDELINEEASRDTKFHDALLVSRNTRWIPHIEALLETDGNIMVAVGAAHLAGDDSVIEMLRAKGYKIEGP